MALELNRRGFLTAATLSATAAAAFGQLGPGAVGQPHHEPPKPDQTIGGTGAV